MDAEPRKLREEDAPARRPRGLRDGGHVYLSCSACRALLMDVYRTRPDEPEVWKLRCDCPFCGDASFVTEVRGGFHRGGYGTLKEGSADDDVASTVVESVESRGDVFFFTVKKASPDARPVRLP